LGASSGIANGDARERWCVRAVPPPIVAAPVELAWNAAFDFGRDPVICGTTWAKRRLDFPVQRWQASAKPDPGIGTGAP